MARHDGAVRVPAGGARTLLAATLALTAGCAAPSDPAPGSGAAASTHDAAAPASPADLDARGQAEAARSRWSAAIRLYREALERDPTWTACRIRMADALQRDGRRSDAIRELRTALQADPASAAANAALGRLLLKDGRAHEALDALRTAHRQDPTDPAIQASLVDALEARGDRRGMKDLLADDPNLTPAVQARLRSLTGAG